MKVGDRVKVVIQDPKVYASGVAKELDGATGVITRENPKSHNGAHPTPSLAFLVEFDEPRARSRSYPSTWSGFWFPPENLRKL